MLRPEAIGEIPVQTVRVVKAAFPRGSTIITLRDAFGTLYQDEDFAPFFSKLGQPALAPWRLALVTVFQFLENLSDTPYGAQAAKPLMLYGVGSTGNTVWVWNSKMLGFTSQY